MSLFEFDAPPHRQDEGAYARMDGILFGTRGSEVRILSPRPYIPRRINRFRFAVFITLPNAGNIREQNLTLKPLNGFPLPSWRHVRVTERCVHVRMSQNRLRDMKRLLPMQ